MSEYDKHIEVVSVPHANISYEERRDISFYKGFDWSKATKEDAVHFARATGFKETGMSVNEVALLYDLLEKKKPRFSVELGRNFGCSTRIILQNTIRNGGEFESWDLKHWPGFLEGMDAAGYVIKGTRDAGALYAENSDVKNLGPLELSDGSLHRVRVRIADSMKTPIVSPLENNDRFVDFLLIDTEHGLEHALGEYMRWRNYLNAGALIAFHDSTLPGPARAIELIKEIEFKACGERIIRDYVNERVDGYGIQVLEWVG